MSTKIILKTGRRRGGTVSRAAIRKAVATVFGNSNTARKVQSAKPRAKKSRASVLPA